MTPFLRKYHRAIWNAFAIVLPALFVAAIFALPKPIADSQFNSRQPAALPQVMKSIETEGFLINLRANPATNERQLEIIVRKPLTVPTALVYLTETAESKPENGILLGNLTATGEHRFELGAAANIETYPFLLLFDPVKNQAIENFELG
ncbi:MAG: hypothetical protein AAB316_22735 [Bacteroidota bacterium]